MSDENMFGWGVYQTGGCLFSNTWVRCLRREKRRASIVAREESTSDATAP